VAGAFYKRTHRRTAIRPERRERPRDVEPEPLPQRRVAHDRPPVLRVRGLSVAFGGVHAVEGVDLDVADGELVGLIGPNGAGKTTLVDAITGFVPFTGSVELNGHDLGRLPSYARARLGLVRTWQSTELLDDLDVRENLVVASGGNKTPPSPDTEETLSLVGLDWAAHAMPSELSEGQRKLAGVTPALAGEPRLLCLDEPAAGLDSRESEALGRRLRSLANGGQSTLLIDHDMGLVLGICDRVVVLHFGRVIGNGTPEVVRDDPSVIEAYVGVRRIPIAASGSPRGSSSD
jgi:branched-chain amino acid transport system ATP-binding protein